MVWLPLAPLPILQQKLEYLDVRQLVAGPTGKGLERPACGWAPYRKPGFCSLLCQGAAGHIVLPLN